MGTVGALAQSRLAALAVALAPSMACGGAAFVCEAGQCGPDGQCQADGWCSFPDIGCASGQRYGAHAGDGVGGTCVPVGPLGSSGGDATAPGDGSEAGSGGASGSSTDAGSADTLALTSSPVSADGTDTGSPPPDSTGRYDDGASSTGAPTQRVTDGLLVLYRFDESAGDLVADLSGIEPPIDLTIEAENGSPTWVADGLSFTGGGIARALGSASKIREGCKAGDALTVEAWVTPSNLTQTGPTRIATLSLDTSFRSFTLGLGQDADLVPSWAARINTTTGLDGNGTPTIWSPAAATTLTHVAFSRDPDGTVEVWVDAALATSDVRDGDLSSWPTEHGFAVGNELDLQRPFFGVIHLVAVYDRALAADEIAQNFDAGP